MDKLNTKLVIISLFSLVAFNACDPTFNDVVCKDGEILIMPIDDHSKYYSKKDKYQCGVRINEDVCESDDVSYNGRIKTTNGCYATYSTYKKDPYSNSLYHCTWLPDKSREQGFFADCHYEECPDCFVVFCDKDDQLVLSHKKCSAYVQEMEATGSFNP